MTIYSYIKKSVPKLKISGCMIQAHPTKIFYVLNALSFTGTYRRIKRHQYQITLTDYAHTFWNLYKKEPNKYQHFTTSAIKEFKHKGIKITKWNEITAHISVNTHHWSNHLRDEVKTFYEEIMAVKKHPEKYLARPTDLIRQWHHLQNIRRFIMHHQMSGRSVDVKLQFGWWYLHQMDKADTNLFAKYHKYLHEV